MHYHVSHENQRFGPLTEAEIRDLLQRGVIQWNDPAWTPGMADWSALHTILPPNGTPVGRATPPPLPRMPVTKSAPPLPHAFIDTTDQEKRKASRTLFVGIGLSAALLIALTVAGITMVIRRHGTSERAYRALTADRSGHEPAWQKSSFEPAGPAEAPPPGIFELVRYPSPAGNLAAYLTADPNDGKKHPAMVWAHGGFGGIGSHFWLPARKRNDQSARAFRDKGIVLMCPSWRGENDNPGRFELFFGEVDDLLAAVAYVKTLPYVDPSRVYIGGHSTGGTLTLLASATGSTEFRAAFSFGGMVDGVRSLTGEGYGNTPYPATSMRDHRLRSPIRYTSFIQRPTFYFEGDQSPYSDDARRMEVLARASDTAFHAFILPGDHYDVLHPLTALIADKILSDTGENCGIEFTPHEVNLAYHTAYLQTLATLLKQWQIQGGALREHLDKAPFEDRIPSTRADVDAIRKVMREIDANKESSSNDTANVAALAELRDSIESDEILKLFDHDAAMPILLWTQGRMEMPGRFDPEEARAFLRIVSVLARALPIAGTELVLNSVKREAASDSWQWSQVFSVYDKEHPRVDDLMERLSRNPPEGWIGVTLLDAANSLSLNGWEGKHPFNSEAGERRLAAWLKSRRADEWSYAHSAALGLAFTDSNMRERLLPSALNHPDPHVRLEAAWVDLKHDGQSGKNALVEACADVHFADKAMDYLRELKHEELIPMTALDPNFSAMAKLSRWLQHPNELGQAPLTLEVYDHRKLRWPPSEDDRDVWLLKFTYQRKDEPSPKTAYGMVGGMTWSSFEEFPAPPKPEQLYLTHCALELGRVSGAQEKDILLKTEERARKALQAANPGMFDNL